MVFGRGLSYLATGKADTVAVQCPCLRQTLLCVLLSVASCCSPPVKARASSRSLGPSLDAADTVPCVSLSSRPAAPGRAFCMHTAAPRLPGRRTRTARLHWERMRGRDSASWNSTDCSGLDARLPGPDCHHAVLCGSAQDPHWAGLPGPPTSGGVAGSPGPRLLAHGRTKMGVQGKARLARVRHRLDWGTPCDSRV